MIKFVWGRDNVEQIECFREGGNGREIAGYLIFLDPQCWIQRATPSRPLLRAAASNR